MNEPLWFCAGWAAGWVAAFGSILVAALATHGNPLQRTFRALVDKATSVRRPRKNEDVKIPAGVRPGGNGHIEEIRGKQVWVEDEE